MSDFNLMTPDQQRQDLLSKLQSIGGANGSYGVGYQGLSKATGASTGGVASQSIAALPAAASVLGGSGGAAGAAQGIGGASGGLSGAMGTAGSAVGMLGGLAQIYLGFKAAKLAKKQFNFQKDAYNNNLVNSVKSYNTQMGDRIAARHNTEGRSAAETSSYLNSNRLTAREL